MNSVRLPLLSLLLFLLGGIWLFGQLPVPSERALPAPEGNPAPGAEQSLEAAKQAMEAKAIKFWEELSLPAIESELCGQDHLSPILLGWAEKKAGGRDKLRERWRGFLERLPEGEGRNLWHACLGQLFEIEGNYAEARKEYDQIVKVAKSIDLKSLFKARLAIYEKNPAEAGRLMAVALPSPDHAHSFENCLARACEQFYADGRFDRALELIQAVWDHDKALAWRAQVIRPLADLLHELGKLPAWVAEQEREAKGSTPESIMAAAHLAFLQEYLENRSECQRWTSQIVQALEKGTLLEPEALAVVMRRGTMEQVRTVSARIIADEAMPPRLKWRLLSSFGSDSPILLRQWAREKPAQILEVLDLVATRLADFPAAYLVKLLDGRLAANPNDLLARHVRARVRLREHQAPSWDGSRGAAEKETLMADLWALVAANPAEPILTIGAESLVESDFRPMEAEEIWRKGNMPRFWGWSYTTLEAWMLRDSAVLALREMFSEEKFFEELQKHIAELPPHEKLMSLWIGQLHVPWVDLLEKEANNLTASQARDWGAQCAQLLDAKGQRAVDFESEARLLALLPTLIRRAGEIFWLDSNSALRMPAFDLLRQEAKKEILAWMRDEHERWHFGARVFAQRLLAAHAEQFGLPKLPNPPEEEYGAATFFSAGSRPAPEWSHFFDQSGVLVHHFYFTPTRIGGRRFHQNAWKWHHLKNNPSRVSDDVPFDLYGWEIPNETRLQHIGHDMAEFAAILAMGLPKDADPRLKTRLGLIGLQPPDQERSQFADLGWPRLSSSRAGEVMKLIEAEFTQRPKAESRLLLAQAKILTLTAEGCDQALELLEPLVWEGWGIQHLKALNYSVAAARYASKSNLKALEQKLLALANEPRETKNLAALPKVETLETFIDGELAEALSRPRRTADGTTRAVALAKAILTTSIGGAVLRRQAWDLLESEGEANVFEESLAQIFTGSGAELEVARRRWERWLTRMDAPAYEQAAQNFRQADPLAADPRYALAEYYFERGNSEEALIALREAAAIDPASLVRRQNLLPSGTVSVGELDAMRDIVNSLIKWRVGLGPGQHHETESDWERILDWFEKRGHHDQLYELLAFTGVDTQRQMFYLNRCWQRGDANGALAACEALMIPRKMRKALRWPDLALESAQVSIPYWERVALLHLDQATIATLETLRRLGKLEEFAQAAQRVAQQYPRSMPCRLAAFIATAMVDSAAALAWDPTPNDPTVLKQQPSLLLATLLVAPWLAKSADGREWLAKKCEAFLPPSPASSDDFVQRLVSNSPELARKFAEPVLKEVRQGIFTRDLRRTLKLVLALDPSALEQYRAAHKTKAELSDMWSASALLAKNCRNLGHVEESRAFVRFFLERANEQSVHGDAARVANQLEELQPLLDQGLVDAELLMPLLERLEAKIESRGPEQREMLAHLRSSVTWPRSQVLRTPAIWLIDASPGQVKIGYDLLPSSDGKSSQWMLGPLRACDLSVAAFANTQPTRRQSSDSDSDPEPEFECNRLLESAQAKQTRGMLELEWPGDASVVRLQSLTNDAARHIRYSSPIMIVAEPNVLPAFALEPHLGGQRLAQWTSPVGDWARIQGPTEQSNAVEFRPLECEGRLVSAPIPIGKARQIMLEGWVRGEKCLMGIEFLGPQQEFLSENSDRVNCQPHFWSWHQIYFQNQSQPQPQASSEAGGKKNSAAMPTAIRVVFQFSTFDAVPAPFALSDIKVRIRN